ncbi:hypothetical protein [Mycobacteroides abscessus]|nr:hypothetical protein [Mycobacteroides abscessus]
MEVDDIGYSVRWSSLGCVLSSWAPAKRPVPWSHDEAVMTPPLLR